MGFIGQDTWVRLGKSATNCNFNNRCGLVVEERTMLPTAHPSQALLCII